jgi:hypothetical protein
VGSRVGWETSKEHQVRLAYKIFLWVACIIVLRDKWLHKDKWHPFPV